MTKITEVYAQQLLSALNNQEFALSVTAIQLVIDGMKNPSLLEDVNPNTRASLVRKVLRYVTANALKGTVHADGLAKSANFYEMEEGKQKSFAANDEFTFTLEKNKQFIRAFIWEDYVSFHDIFGYKLVHCSIHPEWSHLDYIHWFEENYEG